MFAAIARAWPPAAAISATVDSSEPAKGWSPSRRVRAAQTMRPPSAPKSLAISAPMPRLAPVTTTTLPSRRPMGGRPRSLDRDEDAVAHLAVDGLGQVPLAPGVLDEDDLARADAALLAVARGDLHAGVEVDDVLAPGRGVPVEVVVGRDLAEDHARGGQLRGQAPAARRLRVLHVQVSPVRFTLCVCVEIVDPHGLLPDRNAGRPLQERRVGLEPQQELPDRLEV